MITENKSLETKNEPSCLGAVSGSALSGFVKLTNKKMRHVENAYNKLEKKMDADGSTMGLLNFIKIENKEDVKGVAPIVSFTIQSDPIGEVGINGCQALDMLKYVACLFESLNDAFPSSYNETSLAHIENAIQAQNLRTADRIARNVEGQNKA